MKTYSRLLLVFLLFGFNGCSDRDPNYVISYGYGPGRPDEEGRLVNGLKEGRWIFYAEEGWPWQIEHYKNDIPHGPTWQYFENGQKFYDGFYKNGERDGIWIWWGEDGYRLAVSKWENGKLIWGNEL